MNDLTRDFVELVLQTAEADLVKGQGYSLHDTNGVLILCEKNKKNYYLTATILITAKELEGYQRASGLNPYQFMFDLVQGLSFNGDVHEAINREKFDKERTMFSIEKKKVKSDFFGVGDNMFNSANLRFHHHEFYYQVIFKKQKKSLGRKKRPKAKAKAAV